MRQTGIHEAVIGISAPADYPPKQIGSGAGECTRCGRWWTGANTAHCPECHRNFTTTSAFDRHRTGSDPHNDRHCIDPATLTDKTGQPVLVDAGRNYPCWGFPGGDFRWADDEDAG